jgi:hypothetical protein
MLFTVSRRVDVGGQILECIHCEYIPSYLTSYNKRLGLSQSADPKVFLRNTHHLSRLGKLLGRLIDGVECHLPSSPVHSDSLFRVLQSAPYIFLDSRDP